MGKFVTDVQVINAEKRRSPHKHYVYVILVTWSDGSTLTIYRRYSRFFDLQTKLLETFPIEGGTLDPAKRVIPFLPGKIFFGRSQIKDVAMKRLKELNVYCQKLIQLEPKISQCDDVLGFFEIEPEDLDLPVYGTDEGCPLYVDGMLIGGLEPSVRKPKLSLSLSLTGLSKLKSSKEKKAENISSPKRLDGYVAIAEYVAQSSGELTLSQGTKVEVLEKNENGWWFVNSEDAQGWVPSTFLEPESGADPKALQGPVASPGQEESYICIDNFVAESTDEVSLEKGAVVQVLQKNLDGWWLVRYNNCEAYAPGTVLKKVSNPRTVSMVEKSQLSGVEIISSLHDVSNLLNQSSKTDQTDAKGKLESRASVIVKQRSLERGGNLLPPPRQNSINKSSMPSSPSKTNVYMTISDFTDTVGDGISFKKGQKVFVTEKSTTGWWYVKMGDKEGWVVSSYLEPFNGHLSTSSVYEMASVDDTDSANNDYDDEDWYVEPEDDGMEVAPASNENTAKRPLPAIPPNAEKSKPLPGLPTKKPEGFKIPNPPMKPNEVPSETQKTTDVILRPVSKAPDPPSKAAVKSGTDFHKKPGENERPSSGNPFDLASQLKAKLESRSGAVAAIEAPEKPQAKPSVSKIGGPLVPPGKPSLFQKDSHENNHPAGGDNEPSLHGGSLDFASQLKAKFESRSAGAEVSDKSSVPNSGGGGAKFPPAKPSLAQKDSHGNKPSAGGDLRPVLKPPSKPMGANPPPPLKPNISAMPKVNQPTGKPTPPSAKPSPPAPPAKSGLNSESNNNKVTEPNKVSSDRSNVKRLSSTFNAPSSNIGQEKPLPGRPQLPGKPKPAPPSKSSSSNQSSSVNVRPGTQNVNSLANNLSGKLNFGQNPLASKAGAVDEGVAGSSAKLPPPASKKPAFGTSQNAPGSGSGSKIISPMASTYIAVCSFVAENEGELGFTEGDEVEVLEEQSDWCRIRCWDEEGWAPASYLQKL